MLYTGWGNARECVAPHEKVLSWNHLDLLHQVPKERSAKKGWADIWSAQAPMFRLIEDVDHPRVNSVIGLVNDSITEEDWNCNSLGGGLGLWPDVGTEVRPYSEPW